MISNNLYPNSSKPLFSNQEAISSFSKQRGSKEENIPGQVPLSPNNNHRQSDTFTPLLQYRRDVIDETIKAHTHAPQAFSRPQLLSNQMPYYLPVITFMLPPFPFAPWVQGGVPSSANPNMFVTPPFEQLPNHTTFSGIGETGSRVSFAIPPANIEQLENQCHCPKCCSACAKFSREHVSYPYHPLQL